MKILVRATAWWPSSATIQAFHWVAVALLNQVDTATLGALHHQQPGQSVLEANSSELNGRSRILNLRQARGETGPGARKGHLRVGERAMPGSTGTARMGC